MNSETLGKLAEALAKAQGEMENAAKDKDNPFFKSSYADLASIWDACRVPLSKNGLSVVQSLGYQEGKMILTSKLIHASGEWIDSQILVQSVKQDPQSIGSAITYFRRFSLAALVGIAPAEKPTESDIDDDDDGNGASGRVMPQKSIIEQSQTSHIGPKVILPTPNVGTNKSQDDLTAKIKTEASKIKTLRLELGISVDDLKAEVFEEFKTDDFSKLSYEQLVQITSMLQKEKVSRSSIPAPSSQQEAWLAPENHGPVGNTEFQN